MAVVAGCGSPDHASPAGRPLATGSRATYTAGQVLHAFDSVGVPLRNLSDPGSQPYLYSDVTMLATAKPHHGWRLVAYVYPTPERANAAFAEDTGQWSRSGIPSVEVRNVLVVVVPRGRTLTHAAPFTPMPELVYRALRVLRSQSTLR